MHVVLAGQSATGHVYPLLSLADALRPAGHRVSFATTADLVPWLNERGYPASPVAKPDHTVTDLVLEGCGRYGMTPDRLPRFRGSDDIEGGADQGKVVRSW